MAPELDVGMSMGMGRMPLSMVNMDGGAYFCGLPSSDGLPIDDLLDFSHQDVIFDSPPPGYVAETHQPHHLPSHDYSSAFNASDFSDDLYVPSEDAAELEWLSNFVDDSFADTVPFPLSISGGQNSDLSAIPARARSKRSKALQIPTSTWSSPFSTSPTSSSSSLSEFPHGATAAVLGPEVIAGGSTREGGARRCTHCASEKTPQWRTGPLGPKTLCNACGVRYKSGRLVPEYRPAASPTFVLTQHSNSHRKVMELRRQKELVFRHHGGAATATSPSSRPELLFHDHKVS